MNKHKAANTVLKLSRTKICIAGSNTANDSNPMNNVGIHFNLAQIQP